MCPSCTNVYYVSMKSTASVCMYISLPLAPSRTLNSPRHISPPPNSLPTSTLYTFPLNDGEPLLISDDCKPNPLPRPTRRSLPANATSRVALCADEWSHTSDSTGLEQTRSPEHRFECRDVHNMYN